MKVTIEGFIAREADGEVWFHRELPVRFHEDFITYWQSRGYRCKLDDAFARTLGIQWCDSPRKVELTINEI